MALRFSKNSFWVLAILLLPSLVLAAVPNSTTGAVAGHYLENYTASLQSSFGTAPYHYALVSGSLPAGLSLSSNGKITGKPETMGRYSFQIAVTDSSAHPLTSNSQVTITVSLGLDPYGGLTSIPSKNGASGYFRMEKADGRWSMVSPLGNTFYINSVFNAAEGFIERSVLTARYGTNMELWATHRGERMQSWYFNTLGEYTSQRGLPVGTWGGHNGNSVKLPFILLFPTAGDAYLSPSRLGLPQALKNIVAGVPHSTYNGYQGRLLDVFDPEWQQAYTAELANQNTAITGGFANVPWIVGITIEDADYFWALKSVGNNPVAPYPHPSFLIATTNFKYAGFADGKLYAKYAWVAYLQQKYGTIQALNTAWGTSSGGSIMTKGQGFYTAFGDAGGYGTGTGVLDEDGRHSWMGHDPYMLAGENTNLKADMDAFLYQYTYQLASVAVKTIRSYDQHHIIFGPSALGGNGNYGVRPPVAQALKDAGVNSIALCYDPLNPPSLNNDKAVYDLVGLPVLLWYGVTANADSYWHGYAGDYHAPDFGTQVARGQHYASDQESLFNAKGSNGDYYILGTDTWSLTDSGTAEKTNWGLTSNRDNPYDGKQATITGNGRDQWGFPTGGEDLNYGDFIDTVTQTNLNILMQLIEQKGGAH